MSAAKLFMMIFACLFFFCFTCRRIDMVEKENRREAVELHSRSYMLRHLRHAA